MSSYIYVFILLLAFSFFYLRIAKRFNIVDKPNYRSSHTKPTIRGGGIVFLLGLLIYFVLSGFKYPWFVAGTAIIAVLSFIDDIITLSSKMRWPFQLLAVLLLLYEIGFENFPVWTYFPIVILALGFINFFNFMDGINGITGLSALVLLLSYYYINMEYPVVEDSFIIIMAISIVVFGYFNFRKKAMMFAGDIGSITIAMILLFMGLELILATKSPLIIVLYMVYGADSTLTIFYRIFKREKISKPHRHHIYQKLVDNFGYTHMQVSVLYAVMQVFISAIAIYVLFNVSIKYHFIIGFIISQVLTVFYIYLFKKNEKR